MIAILIMVVLGVLGMVSDSENSITTIADLDKDGLNEKYRLVNHRLTVSEGEKALWQSPVDWRIDNVVLGDVDNNGTVNLVITLWKAGSYGKVKPFWQIDDDIVYKNHLFVYQLKDKLLKQVWCSSDLDYPIISLTIQDVDSDGKLELVVKEGQYWRLTKERYTLNRFAQSRTAIWRWDEWGFRWRGILNAI